MFAEEEALLLTAAASGEALEGLVARRVRGEPLEYLLGRARFCGRDVVVAPGVFVPRRRSELLVELALAVVPGPPVADRAPPGVKVRGLPGSAPVVVDLCCGSGALGVAVAAGRPDAEVHGADLDPSAVACARRNLPADRVHHGDLYAALPPRLRGAVDVLLVNAPYVPSEAIATMPPEARDHEPRLALDGGGDGLDLHRRVADGARGWLRPGGHLVLESSRDLAPRTAAACRAAGLEPRVVTDDDRDATAVLATAP